MIVPCGAKREYCPHSAETIRKAVKPTLSPYDPYRIFGCSNETSVGVNRLDRRLDQKSSAKSLYVSDEEVLWRQPRPKTRGEHEETDAATAQRSLCSAADVGGPGGPRESQQAPARQRTRSAAS
jgi:hypothetical protein